MAGLGKSEITLRDYPSGANILTLDVDPLTWNVFNVPIRGSVTKVLDGTTVRQFFGVNRRDYVIEAQGFITELDTLVALWDRYKAGGVGALYQVDDWYGNRFVCVFTPGVESFRPSYISGAKNAHQYSLSLTVCDILLLFGSSY